MIVGPGEAFFGGFCSPEEGMNMRRGKNSRNIGYEDKEYKSKNLMAERKRRQKLSDRLLELRSLVPNITNMNKATIITDAITYIEELQGTVKELSDQLYQIVGSFEEELETQNKVINDTSEEMKKWGIEPEVLVTLLNGTMFWIQVVCPKKYGGFTKLMEAFSALGFDPKDVSVTTLKGALLFNSSVEAIHGGFTKVDQIKSFLLETIRSI